MDTNEHESYKRRRRVGVEKFQIPTSNIQKSSKHQTPSSKPGAEGFLIRARRFGFRAETFAFSRLRVIILCPLATTKPFMRNLCGVIALSVALATFNSTTAPAQTFVGTNSPGQGTNYSFIVG